MSTNWPYKTFLIGLLLLLSLDVRAACSGAFTNPVSDLCISCMFPMRISGVKVADRNQLDNLSSNDVGIGCSCLKEGSKSAVGIPWSFWEPVRKVDVTRDPFCFSALGGTSLGQSGGGNHGRLAIRPDARKEASYHAHYYLDPILYVFNLILNQVCLERQGFDLAYATELDPGWTNPQIAMLKFPDAFLLANPAAALACTADCLAATVESGLSYVGVFDPPGFGLNTLYWCSGCNGVKVPFMGFNQMHIGGVTTSSLIADRLITMMHRMGIMNKASGKDSMCQQGPFSGLRQLMMDKTNYKYTMNYPVPQTSGATDTRGRCCQPFGCTTTTWDSGREYPGPGENFVYTIFRKRDCCYGIYP